MKDKVMLITGASSGIGKVIAEYAAKEGARLILVARNAKALNILAKQLYQDYRIDVLVVSCDLSITQQIDRLMRKIEKKYQTVDILINCAGYGIFKDASDFTYDEILAMFQVNTFGMMYLANKVTEMMKQRQSGHIFFLSSIAGKISTPSSSVYSATKSAIISYANALRLELKQYNISVTTVNPGPVTTPFFSYSDQMQNYYEKVKHFSIEPERIAKKMIQVAKHQPNRREINIPLSMASAAVLYHMFPKIGDYLALNAFNFK